MLAAGGANWAASDCVAGEVLAHTSLAGKTYVLAGVEKSPWCRRDPPERAVTVDGSHPIQWLEATPMGDRLPGLHMLPLGVFPTPTEGEVTLVARHQRLGVLEVVTPFGRLVPQAQSSRGTLAEAVRPPF